MRDKENPPDLATLRRIFGRPLPAYLPTVEKQVRPGLWRKLYGKRVSESFALIPTTWKLGTELHSPEEVSKQLGKLPLIELAEARDDLLKQMFAHAYCGNEQAINLLISTARGAIHDLQDLEKYQPASLQAKAQESPLWPVLLSLNPQDLDDATKRIARLKVGTKTLTPRRPGQRLDARNFWTQLAEVALHACDDNKITVPLLEAHTRGARRVRMEVDVWKTPVGATYYYLANGDCIIIRDWERDCKDLSAPITKANFSQWWKVIQLCIIDYWFHYRKAYDDALTRIGQRGEEEARRRNLAVTALRQALRSLVAIR